MSFGAISLDTVNMVVTFEGEEIELPRREYMLLKSLLENAVTDSDTKYSREPALQLG